MILRRWIFLALWLCTGCFGIFAATFSVTVKVVDAENKLVPKADVALFWQAKGGMTPMSDRGAATDDSGKAVLQVDDWNEKRPVLVLSADRT